MLKKFLIISLFLITASSLTACSKPTTTKPAKPTAASVYCQESGGLVEIRSDENGEETGWCIFPDNSQCEEWAFFRGECQPIEYQPARNEVEKFLQENNLQECIVGRNELGQSKIKLVDKEQNCPAIETEQELKEFCGKDTAQVSKCGDFIKLTSSIPEAGEMFFQDNQILTCPPRHSSVQISQDCKKAMETECEPPVNCRKEEIKD